MLRVRQHALGRRSVGGGLAEEATPIQTRSVEVRRGIELRVSVQRAQIFADAVKVACVQFTRRLNIALDMLKKHGVTK